MARRLVLGSTKLKVAAGQTMRVKLVLSKKGPALLRKLRAATVRINISLKPPAAAAASTSRVTKVLAPKRHR